MKCVSLALESESIVCYGKWRQRNRSYLKKNNDVVSHCKCFLGNVKQTFKFIWAGLDRTGPDRVFALHPEPEIWRAHYVLTAEFMTFINNIFKRDLIF